ncbi:MAG TPA: DUF421 domain-containing protein [Syntrophomonas sp.]|nr:DUF421 domain-containing protein [Syntrophomonas sp.]
MILVIIRTLILFGTTVIFLRIMGKRQIGQLQPYELVVIIMISELAAIPMQNTGIPILNGLIPIFVLFTCEVTLSFIALKSERARGVICGKPSILIEKSRIMELEMKRLRYNINDLLEQLRQKNVTDIGNVEFAILETSGQLSVILKSDKRPLQPQDMSILPSYEGLPITLIIDGHIIHRNLQQHLSLDWLMNELSLHGVKDYRKILFACLDSGEKFFYQIKESAQHK